EVKSTETQTVFLFLNNVEIPLIPVSSTDKTKFRLVGLKSDGTIPAPEGTTPLTPEQLALYNALNALNRGGNNVLKFTFYSKSYNFTSTYNFTIMPKDLPKIPADNSEGVFPYESIIQWPPVYNSTDYQQNGTSYTTRKGTANILGTFNLLNISELTSTSTETNLISQIQSKVDGVAQKSD